MLKFHKGAEPSTERELVLLWASSTGTRCVLVGTSQAMDLHLIRDGVVIRRMAHIDARSVRDVAQQWRLEYEMAPDRLTSASPCPECGDEAWVNYLAVRGLSRRQCGTCGHDWPTADRPTH
jgi:predicted RNA-binding Zn-ribbon protein involved in translation (DUF1610 family)